jgi:hypothetical protein
MRAPLQLDFAPACPTINHTQGARTPFAAPARAATEQLHRCLKGGVDEGAA